jgi:hypothetical protein
MFCLWSGLGIQPVIVRNKYMFLIKSMDMKFINPFVFFSLYVMQRMQWIIQSLFHYITNFSQTITLMGYDLHFENIFMRKLTLF